MRVMFTQPKSFFSEDYILALRACCPLKFLHMLQNDQGLSGTGVPQHFFNTKDSKNGPKFGVPQIYLFFLNNHSLFYF